jgi:murein DD-endopeptidase MepM/ murein hydrolase activator NlpD
MKRLILIALLLIPVLSFAHDPDDVIKTLDLMYRASRAVDSGKEALERDDLANIPQGWPCRGILISGFGMRKHPVFHVPKHHDGIDIATSTGTPVHATGGGTVEYAGWGIRGGGYGGYGRIVVIRHSPHLVTMYAHLSEITVRVGEEVTRGDVVGLVGQTGIVTGPHLHYEIRVDDDPVDPMGWI